LGLHREERLLLLAPDNQDWPVAFLGALYAGMVPVPTKNILVRKPLMPLPAKYSAFATKVTFRRTISGMKIESENDKWLLAMIAAPSAGTLSAPSTRGRNSSRNHGPRRTNFNNQ
jgi:acyl-CoA synthetase (AMP-forming)/AMP-acid ligase II